MCSVMLGDRWLDVRLGNFTRCFLYTDVAKKTLNFELNVATGKYAHIESEIPVATYTFILLCNLEKIKFCFVGLTTTHSLSHTSIRKS